MTDYREQLSLVAFITNNFWFWPYSPVEHNDPHISEKQCILTCKSEVAITNFKKN